MRIVVGPLIGFNHVRPIIPNLQESYKTSLKCSGLVYSMAFKLTILCSVEVLPRNLSVPSIGTVY